MTTAECAVTATPMPAVSADEFRHAMAGLSAAVHIITSDGPHGQVGFTATAVCSVTDSPPTLLVCLNRSASAHAALTANAVLCVNTLTGEQQDLSNLFGGKTAMAERFAAGSWTPGATGISTLDGAAIHFECRVTQTTSVGTHDVLFCEVLAVRRDTDLASLVYLDRQYHVLPPRPLPL